MQSATILLARVLSWRRINTVVSGDEALRFVVIVGQAQVGARLSGALGCGDCGACSGQRLGSTLTVRLVVQAGKTTLFSRLTNYHDYPRMVSKAGKVGSCLSCPLQSCWDHSARLGGWWRAVWTCPARVLGGGSSHPRWWWVGWGGIPGRLALPC